MKVLLSKDVSGLGKAGQVKEVSDGHARNFLFPKHLAMPATTAVLAQVQKEEKEKQEKIKKQEERLLKLKNKLEGKTVVIKAKSSGKNLFASLHQDQIALALTEKLGIEISPQLLTMDKAIKTLGLHVLELKLSELQKVKINVNIEAI